MYDVVLFAGTDEGHKIADFLKEKNINHIVCVATEYGGQILDNENVHIGRMTAEDMQLFFEKTNAKIVVDATHPYADKVTENIKSSCKCKYIRVVREDTEGNTNFGKSFENIGQAVKYLESKVGNILITTGSKDIAEYTSVKDRAFARVLPMTDSLRSCLDAGFEPKRIICMQGPFSKEFNGALIRELDIKYLVTKRTGKSGGFLEKVESAMENGAECVIIERPVKEDGVTADEAKNLILEWL